MVDVIGGQISKQLKRRRGQQGCQQLAAMLKAAHPRLSLPWHQRWSQHSAARALECEHEVWQRWTSLVQVASYPVRCW